MLQQKCILAGLLFCGLTALAQTNQFTNRWVAPARAAARKNPVAVNETSIALGKNVYERHCLSCHGPKGKGDGPASAHLETPPGNLADPALWKQSDGALLWKITEGHKPMPTFENLTSDEERWPAINYIRTFAPKPAASDQSKPEKPNGEKPKRETKR
jgi:mono/diheme cytochrome c family protein